MKPIQKELGNLYRKQQILGLLVFSFVTIMVWVGLSLFRSQSKTSISPALQQLAKPLTPSLNQQVLEQIEEKRAYDDSELQSFPIFTVLTEDRRRAPSPIPTNATTSLTTLTSSELEATASGEIEAIPEPDITQPSPTPDATLNDEEPVPAEETEL